MRSESQGRCYNERELVSVQYLEDETFFVKLDMWVIYMERQFELGEGT